MKKRIDVLLFERGLCPSRSKAAAEIAAMHVKVNGVTVQKPSELYGEDDEIELTAKDAYVSRGAYKLKGAIDAFGVSLSGKTVADIGASTGGFTQVCLEQGAKKVYAIDVGEGQLAEAIASDPRVVQIDHCNARYLTSEALGGRVDAVVMDVSFISQTLIYPSIKQILKDGGFAIVLVKPQFECGRAHLGKNGIVKDPKGIVIAQILDKLRSCAAICGLEITAVCDSPITGGDGNKEYLINIKTLGEGNETSKTKGDT